MSRPWKIEFSGALYHVLSRGNEQGDLFLYDEIIKPANNHPSAGSIRSTVSMLEQLPWKLKSQIGYENAYRLYKLKK